MDIVENSKLLVNSRKRPAMDGITVNTYRSPMGRNSKGRVIEGGRQEIELITGGRGYFVYEGQTLEATQGCILWHLPGEWTIYRSDHDNPYECLVLIFPYRTGQLRPAPRFSRWTDPGACMHFANEILTYFHGENPNLPILAEYAFNVLRWQAAQWERSKVDDDLSMPLQRAMRLIENRFAEQLPIHDIAREAGISTAHIHALFQARFGTSPHQKLTDVRLSEARRLLASTRRSIKDIAASVGYPDAASFCKLFKARCGFRPLEYRQRHIRKDGEGFSPETAPVQPV